MKSKLFTYLKSLSKEEQMEICNFLSSGDPALPKTGKPSKSIVEALSALLRNDIFLDNEDAFNLTLWRKWKRNSELDLAILSD